MTENQDDVAMQDDTAEAMATAALNERNAALAHIDAMDQKAALVLTFAAVILAVPAFASSSDRGAIWWTSALLALVGGALTLWAAWPRSVPQLSVVEQMIDLRARPSAVFHESIGSEAKRDIPKLRDIANQKARLIRLALILLGAGAVVSVLAVR